MPVTPLHLGPGAAIKAVFGKHLSFTVFTFTQAVIDLESATRFLREDEVLHGISHTYLGATGDGDGVKSGMGSNLLLTINSPSSRTNSTKSYAIPGIDKPAFTGRGSG